MTRNRLACVIGLAITIFVFIGAPGVADAPPATRASASQPATARATSRPTADLDFENAAGRITMRMPTSDIWKAVANDMTAMRREILEDLYRITGLTLPLEKKVEINFAQPARGGTWGFTAWRKSGASILVQSNNPTAQRSLLGRALLQHEMTHALQNSWLDKPAENTFPQWILEGLPTYAAGQGPRKVRSNAARSGTRFIDGLSKHSYGADSDYAEEYLAFVFMEELAGPQGIKQFALDITIERMAWKDALKKATNMDFPEFEKAARDYSIDFVAQVIPGKPSKDQPPDLDESHPRSSAATQPQAAAKEASTRPSPAREVAAPEPDPPAGEIDPKVVDALQQAINAGEIERIKSLLSANAKVAFYKDGRGAGPLHWAAAAGKSPAIELLLDRKANVNAKTATGATPLHYANTREVVDLLCERGAEINAAGAMGMTPLHAAAWAGNLEKVKALLAHKADVNARSKNGQAPLHGAAWSTGPQIATAILSAGADVNAKDSLGRTPLYYATRWYVRPEFVEVLKKQGGQE